MPPKVDIKILSGKRDNAKHALYELFNEFEALYSVKPELNLLSTVFKEIETKYRGIKKQIEVIADRFVEEEVTSEDERVTNNLKSGDEIKQRYLKFCKNTQVTKRNLALLNYKIPLRAPQFLEK